MLAQEAVKVVGLLSSHNHRVLKSLLESSYTHKYSEAPCKLKYWLFQWTAVGMATKKVLCWRMMLNCTGYHAGFERFCSATNTTCSSHLMHYFFCDSPSVGKAMVASYLTEAKTHARLRNSDTLSHRYLDAVFTPLLPPDMFSNKPHVTWLYSTC